MFLHLGTDKVIPLKNIIAILDIKTAKSNITGKYLKKIRENKKLEVIDVSESDAKSYIITEKIVYFSAISVQTLKKRAGLF